MAKIQCKMCGGQVELPNGITAGECPYCGSLTTFPKIGDEQTERFYARAEHFRQASNFDKAVAAYEAILNLNSEDPEAYWGVLISKYGIEYVEDPATHERIPTCHRVQFDSILADSDYLNALKYASPDERAIYEKEANRIAEIQKGILRISAQEKPYDVFICYKETTDGGTRTKDSTLAQDIYYQLTNQGLKVFFSRITLEDKLGQQYEPYIFAALNSAKVMLVIGSKKEYFEAVWVKNEWSRLLALSKKDRSKLLIPCYKDMDPYDIPEELSMFQSQDMSRIGFMQDILRGIMKVVNAGRNEMKSAAVPSISFSAPVSFETSKIMKRIAVLLEQQEWTEAGDYCKRLLESDPENPELYLIMCQIVRRIPGEDALRKSAQDLASDKNFQIALKFATPERRKQLVSIQQDALVGFHLKNCMKANRAPDLAHLAQCDVPLSDDADFRAALQASSPERERELLQIQYDQAELFLSRLKTKYSVSAPIAVPVPLDMEKDFQSALKCASPERRKELEEILSRQSEYFLGKCMESCHVSTEADLLRAESPLAADDEFKIALLCASPERRELLQKLQSEQTEFFLRKCMETNHISGEAELPSCSSPLNEDKYFMLAVRNATPERREQLERIQTAQSDAFLDKCLKIYHASKPSDLVEKWGSVNNDLNFRLALASALPEQKKRLDKIASDQMNRIYTTAILSVVVALEIVLLFIWFFFSWEE